MKLKVKQAFDWAHQGIRVEKFSAGQVLDTEDAELISVSVREGWAEEFSQSKAPPENKAEKAPEKKAKGKN